VRVLIDTRANASYPLNADRLEELQTAGIPMRRRLTSYILHWKMMLFHGQDVVQFSGATTARTRGGRQPPPPTRITSTRRSTSRATPRSSTASERSSTTSGGYDELDRLREHQRTADPQLCSPSRSCPRICHERSARFSEQQINEITAVDVPSNDMPDMHDSSPTKTWAISSVDIC